MSVGRRLKRLDEWGMGRHFVASITPPEAHISYEALCNWSVGCPLPVYKKNSDTVMWCKVNTAGTYPGSHLFIYSLEGCLLTSNPILHIVLRQSLHRTSPRTPRLDLVNFIIALLYFYYLDKQSCDMSWHSSLIKHDARCVPFCSDSDS